MFFYKRFLHTKTSVCVVFLTSQSTVVNSRTITFNTNVCVVLLIVFRLVSRVNSDCSATHYYTVCLSNGKSDSWVVKK